MKARLAKLALAAGAAAVALLAGLSGAQAAQVTTPAASTPVLFSVHCIGNSFCLGTGGSGTGKHFVGLGEEWTGKAWRVIATPAGYQNDITCGGPTFCLASAQAGREPARELVWNGKTWRRMSPQPPSFGIGCLSPTFCVNSDTADGSDGNYWNGKIWQDMPMGSGGCGGAWCDYSGVGCASATLCWDSGTYCATSDCDGGEISFTDTWNGTAWNQAAGGNLGYHSCAARSFC